MKAAALLLLFPAIVCGHVISMSTGWATVYGSRVEYLLRMPRYELPEGRDPSEQLFGHIRFSSGFETGRRVAAECHNDNASVTYLCGASYQFSRPVERLSVECTFYEITVPNHIHMLHADRNGRSDQAILDSTFSSATLAFRPPTKFEKIADQSGAGAFRVWSSWPQLLLIVALVLASRGRKEFLLLTLALIAGQWIGTAGILRFSWQPSPRFTEAAVALALAYLALEILAFPASTGRWLLALIFGAFTGMYFAQFIADSGYRPELVLSGATFGVLAVLGLAGLVSWGTSKLALHRALHRVAATILLATGSIWFVVRLRG